MKEEIRLLIEDLLTKGSDDDIQVLHQMIVGLKKKNEGHYNSYVGALLNMEKESSSSTCSITVPVSKLIHNSLGIVHGGMTATVIDTAMGTLANMLAPKNLGAVTSQLTIHFLLPINGDTMTATAHILHQGKKTMVVEGYIINEAGKRLAHATGSFYLIDKS